VADKEQFKFYAEPHLRDRLERCAAKSGYASPQQFVIAALDNYAELLVDLLNEARQQHDLLRERQREQLLSKGGQGQASGKSRNK